MTEQEFNSRFDTLEVLSKELGALYSEIDGKNNGASGNVKSLLQTLEGRNRGLTEYIKLLKEFSFSDNLTSPSDLFPGIRTVSQTSDPETLKKKTDSMKEYAGKVDELTKQTELFLTSAIKAVKEEYGALVMLSTLSGKFYDECMSLLKDMDSIYDIGQLSSMT